MVSLSPITKFHAAQTAQNLHILHKYNLDRCFWTLHSEFMKSHYSARQFARLIGKNNRTITLWIKKGLIPGAKKVGNNYQIPVEELDRAKSLDVYPDPNI